MDRWIDGRWTDSKHLSSITTDENRMIQFVWHFCLICLSHNSIHLEVMRGNLSHPYESVGERNPKENRQTCARQLCQSIPLFKCMQEHSYNPRVHTISILFFKVIKIAIILTPIKKKRLQEASMLQ